MHYVWIRFFVSGLIGLGVLLTLAAVNVCGGDHNARSREKTIQANQKRYWQQVKRETGQAAGAVGTATKKVAGSVWETTMAMSKRAWFMTKRTSNKTWHATKRAVRGTAESIKEGMSDAVESIRGE